MVKYIIIIIIVLLGGVLFINKDKLLSLSIDSDANTAAVISAARETGSGTTTPVYYKLKVAKIGDDGKGKVSPQDGGIKEYEKGKVITLTASGAMGSPGRSDTIVFVGWSGGGCSGRGPCTVKMDKHHTVAAYFKVFKKSLRY